MSNPASAIPSAATGNASRYRAGRHAAAEALNTLAGFAVTGNTAYWMTTGVGGCPDRGSEQPTCRLQRARLRFVPAGRPRGTATVPVPGRVDLSRDP